MWSTVEEIRKYQQTRFKHLGIHLHLETADGYNDVNELQEIISNKFLLRFKDPVEVWCLPLMINSFEMNPASQEQLLNVFSCLEPGYIRTISLKSQNQRKTKDCSTEALLIEIEKLHVQMRALVLKLPSKLGFPVPLFPSKLVGALKKRSYNEPVYLEVNRIVEDDHWICAKKLFMKNLIISTPIKNFVNFECVEITLKSISSEDLNYVKNLLLSYKRPGPDAMYLQWPSLKRVYPPPTPISFQIGYIDFAVNSLDDSVSFLPYQTFGQPQTVFKEDKCIVNEWYIPVPESDEDLIISHRSDKLFKFWRADSQYRKNQEKRKCDWTGLVLFANMFPVVMDSILAKTYFRSLIKLRKVCSDLRTFIDDCRINHHLRKITISISLDSIDTYFGYFEDLIHVIYKADDTGCVMSRERREEEKSEGVDPFKTNRLENFDYFTVFFNDFHVNFGYPWTIMEEFSIELPCLMEEQQEIGNQFMGRLKEYLSSRRDKLSVKKLTMKLFLQAQIMDILPYINPNKLNGIELKNQREQKGRLDIREVIKLDQWKKAKELLLTDFVISVPVDNLTHFTKVSGCVETNTVSDLLVLKKTCLESPKEFSLECEIFDLEDLNTIFGRPFVEINEGTRIRKWFFRIPNELEEVVQLVIIMEFSSLKFSRIPVLSIPQNGVIRD